ncbi:hypothetical protein SAMN05192559_10513 [Halobacillus karajensis]|uniref:Uncharacterized protein n=1 Tax=Halobacillus karajensis TaxID=195088 RepID=A0A024P642_9BACI|nr:hypothetical protein BN982_03067 [Halobacillus karajensis]CDQ23817.1 hypothetical protein BN983_02068 [Halobacillus karajensis]CDQ27295.1 hypothetical protein BN981_01549 [Halobacillus karajensis]SEH86984.1 hypothetical protein SAMN05192559_10513 [Halobacillus karajensis]
MILPSRETNHSQTPRPHPLEIIVYFRNLCYIKKVTTEYIFDSGADKRPAYLLKREIGDNPMLSRNCIWERTGRPLFSGGNENGKDPASDDHKPGDLPVSASIIPYEDRRC